MKIATFGSKICDDAALCSRGALVNVSRVVELSPFCIFEKGQSELNLAGFQFDNSYQKKMFELDINKKYPQELKNMEADFFVFDICSARVPFHEFILEDGTCFRATETKALKDNIELLRNELVRVYGKNITEEKVVLPLKWDKAILDYELKMFLKKLVKYVTQSKIVLLEVRNIFEYIDKKNRIKVLDNIVGICEQNEFYNYCTEIIEKEGAFCKIPKLKNNIGDDRFKEAFAFNYCKLYYQYICDMLVELKKNGKESEKIKRSYESRIEILIDEAKYDILVDLVFHNLNGRKLVMIGLNLSMEYLLLKKYGIQVFKNVPYTEDTSEEELQAELEEIRYQSEKYLCVVPRIFRGTSPLKCLWKNGYGYGQGYLCARHEIINLVNFSGVYEDVWDNKIECIHPTSISILGIGNSMYCDVLSCKNIRILNNVIFLTGRNVDLGKEFTSNCYDEAYIEVKENVALGEKSHIRASFFTETVIGKDCRFGREIIIFNGDGHAIFDLNTGKNINYDLNNSKWEKHVIRIGNNTCAGDNCFILCGSDVGENCVIQDNSFVNRKFSDDCKIGGCPAQVLAENVERRLL